HSVAQKTAEVAGGGEEAVVEEASVPYEVVEYRNFFGIDGRLIVWIVAELHLMFAAFVLGVPIFAVIVEIIGVRSKDARFDNLAREFTKLLSAAFATTASLGGLMAFALYGLYPGFMRYMTDVFHPFMFVYALCFFGEAFCLYGYYYSWDLLSKTTKGKWFHISLGISLNLFGTALMFLANSWSTFMMAPAGIDMKTGAVTSLYHAFDNFLWMPINIHRLIANVAFGGFMVGAYAAIKFMGARTDEEKAHYDWMGYLGNFIGLGALIPLPFAGYYLGREIYTASPVMGNIMMGGAFSWTFIIQAILIGMLFIGGNYYLWNGMERIEGAERYKKYVVYINGIIIFCFAVWLTPHNLPLSGEERALIGEQYHPFSKFFGVMAAKNAVVNLMILATFVSFLLYRRANKGEIMPFSKHSKSAKTGLIITAGLCIMFLAWYALGLTSIELDENLRQYVTPLIVCLSIQIAAIIVAICMAFLNKGKFAQAFLLGMTTALAVIYLAYYGFVVMEKANIVLRYLSVAQVSIVISCLIMTAVMDVVLFKNAKEVGHIQWGKIPLRAQYALLLLCVAIVTLMGLMGFIRSGLRMNWHVYGFMQDTSAGAFTPSISYMGWVTCLIVALFLGLVTFVFWLAGLGDKKREKQSYVFAANRGEIIKGNRSFVKATVFSFLILGFFAYVCIYVTGISGDSGGGGATGVNPEAGEKIYWGDGQCHTCHSIGTSGSATRGPNQEGLALKAEETAKKRGLGSGLEYMVESIVSPDAYVVEGYDKIMPKVYDPPIMLGREKIMAVLSYLQTLGGESDIDAIMKFKDKIPEASKDKVIAWTPPIEVDPSVGAKLFFDDTLDAACSKCHMVNGKGAKVGPDLTGIGAVQTPQYLIESILKPSEIIVKGFETMYLITTDGMVYNGIVQSQDEEEIVLLVDEEGEIAEYVFYPDEIAQMQKQDISMMPGNFSKMLTTNDFYGMISYLLSLK
ncbi:MAG: cytochrome ubiquinol oxidase subunit I, partial [Candidatus Scalindua sp.]|nr:cytochrome ubiquinol oxidase subunit I [Candidatus Scalindua sp.]MCR4344846.1 cytochrome ubiquinol oxidase subunit I [Candidatus Scalindua sp.]